MDFHIISQLVIIIQMDILQCRAIGAIQLSWSVTQVQQRELMDDIAITTLNLETIGARMSFKAIRDL